MSEPDARRETVPCDRPTCSAKSACLTDWAFKYEDSTFMLSVMPDRNIPVKHTYSRPEFGVMPEVDKFRGMNNIAAIRKSKNLSQAELADMVGIEQSTISKLERGNKSVTLRTIQLVADALDVSVSDLFIDRTDAERTIIAAYRSLPEQRRRGWQDMAKAVISEDEGAEPPPAPRSDSVAG